ncbi:hypothetical protein LXL04_024259 [Taraxacum kok-saghyz]
MPQDLIAAAAIASAAVSLPPPPLPPPPLPPLRPDLVAVVVIETIFCETRIKINNLDLIKERGYSRSRISSRAIEAFLIQILKTGFFNGDPHLAIDSDESLIYYVFGMMGEIKSFTREILMDLFYANYEKDAKKVMKSLISLEALQPTGDIMFDKSCSTSTYRRHDSSM